VQSRAGSTTRVPLDRPEPQQEEENERLDRRGLENGRKVPRESRITVEIVISEEF
jgi:hypothetical protein